ncbi:MAG: amino acid ABC transporter permease [Clostridia bacterium]|nr:amino acid ABC transporter permease [Clostridia bacterium]MBO5315648.1 amino acid ABC transporter permease [Clostridia bacterium]MBR3806023.1 amino acid ABC transporter permease [Clostridia bacterium]
MDQFLGVTGNLLLGFAENMKLFFATLLFAIPLGLIIAIFLLSKFKPLKALFEIIVWIVRGSPLMLQLFVVFYVPGILFDMPMRNRFLAALIAFVINYACYFAEIFRGGIISIPQGQSEAGKVLGMTKSEIFFKVTLMQVVKRIVPPMGNEVITLVKDTSLARVIAVSEVIMSATEYSAVGIIWPLFYTGAFFLLFNGLLTILLGKLENKLDYYKG